MLNDERECWRSIIFTCATSLTPRRDKCIDFEFIFPGYTTTALFVVTSKFKSMNVGPRKLIVQHKSIMYIEIRRFSLLLIGLNKFDYYGGGYGNRIKFHVFPHPPPPSPIRHRAFLCSILFLAELILSICHCVAGWVSLSDKNPFNNHTPSSKLEIKKERHEGRETSKKCVNCIWKEWRTISYVEDDYIWFSISPSSSCSNGIDSISVRFCWMKNHNLQNGLRSHTELISPYSNCDANRKASKIQCDFFLHWLTWSDQKRKNDHMIDEKIDAQNYRN